VGGVCYTPGAADYASAVTDHDEGVNGVDDHNLDANVWAIPAHSQEVAYDTDGDTTHVYKCGCKEGYNCVAGCSPPFNGHRCEMTNFPTPYPTSSPTTYPTPYPTPYPTSTPTPAPTATCPVTCELEAVDGNKVSHNHDSSWNHATNSHSSITVKVSHDVHVINTSPSYTHHRCYKTAGSQQCECECIGNVDFFQSEPNRGSTGSEDDIHDISDIYNPYADHGDVDPDLADFWSSRAAA